MNKLKLSDKALADLQAFLITRFNNLNDMRQPLDTEITDDIKYYNGNDELIDAKQEWEYKYKLPYIYTIVQTIVARLKESLFATQNYVKIYVEKDDMSDYEKSLERWFQQVLDNLQFKKRAKDFLEDALVQRTTWLELFPKLIDDKGKKKFKGVDFIPHKWFDVWFDTKVAEIKDTDVFIRKVQKAYIMRNQDKIYFNLDKVDKTNFPTDLDATEDSEYLAKQGKSYNRVDDPVKNVELLEWYGVYNVGTAKKPDYKNIICTIANRSVLCRVEENTLGTNKKVLLFPIRPLRQANSLIGKSIPQLTKVLQQELNEIRSMRMQNINLVTKLLFSYNKEGGVDIKELFADGGNAIPRGENPNDVTVLPIPNLIQSLSYAGNEIIQDMQQITGAVDYVMGTSAGRGTTETASGIQTITQQALFKFSAMADNTYDDIIDFINYIFVLYYKYGQDMVTSEYPDIKAFFMQPLEAVEENHIIDIGLKDITQRTDVERMQFINMINVVAGLVQQVGGDTKELLKQIMQRFNIPNIDKILNAGGGQAQMMQMLQQAMQGASKNTGGSQMANPQANKDNTVEEQTGQVNADRH